MQVWKAFVAYQELLVASEYLGRERAMGVIFYTLGEFPTREEYLYFVESQVSSAPLFEKCGFSGFCEFYSASTQYRVYSANNVLESVS